MTTRTDDGESPLVESRADLLAVFEDGANLDETTMQSLALQFNLSETTFVLPSTAATGGAPTCVTLIASARAMNAETRRMGRGVMGAPGREGCRSGRDLTLSARPRAHHGPICRG